MQRFRSATPRAVLASVVVTVAALANPAAAGEGRASGVVFLNHRTAPGGAEPGCRAAAQLSLPLAETPGWNAAPAEVIRRGGAAGPQATVLASTSGGLREQRSG